MNAYILYLNMCIYIYMCTLVPKRVSFYTGTVLTSSVWNKKIVSGSFGFSVVAMDGHPILLDLSMEARTGALEDDVPFQRWDFQVSCQFFVVFFESHEMFRFFHIYYAKVLIKRWFFPAFVWSSSVGRWESTPPPWSSCERWPSPEDVVEAEWIAKGMDANCFSLVKTYKPCCWPLNKRNFWVVVLNHCYSSFWCNSCKISWGLRILVLFGQAPNSAEI